MTPCSKTWRPRASLGLPLILPSGWLLFPVKRDLKNALNIIDLVFIISFYDNLDLDTKVEECEDTENMGKVVEILRLARLFQILKVAWHYTGLWSLGATLRHSYHEVGLLLLFLFVGIPIFSVFIYFVEKDDHMSGGGPPSA